MHQNDSPYDGAGEEAVRRRPVKKIEYMQHSFPRMNMQYEENIEKVEVVVSGDVRLSINAFLRCFLRYVVFRCSRRYAD